MSFQSWTLKYNHTRNIDINIPLVQGGDILMEQLEALDYRHQQNPFSDPAQMFNTLGQLLPDYEHATISCLPRYTVNQGNWSIPTELLYKKPFLYCSPFYDTTSDIISMNGTLEYLDSGNYIDLNYGTGQGQNFPPTYNICDSEGNVLYNQYPWFLNDEGVYKSGAPYCTVGFPIIEVWDWDDIFSEHNTMYFICFFNGTYQGFDGYGIRFYGLGSQMNYHGLKYLTNGAQGERHTTTKDKNKYTHGQPSDDGGNGPAKFERHPLSHKPLPHNFYSDCGLMTVFIPTMGQLKDLSNYLWSSGGLDLNQFKKIQNNPFDLLLGLNFIPFNVTKSGTKGVNVGNILAVDTNISMDYTNQENYEFDFGSVKIDEEYCAFLDYAPHTRMTIHLPYIGAQPIDADMLRYGDFNKHTFHLRYKYNIVTGTVVAYLESDDNIIIGTWASNVATPIPLATNDFTNTINGLIGMATSCCAGLVSGGVMGALGGVTGTANSMTSLKPTISQSGGIGSSASMLAPTDEAYIIVEQPQASIDDLYAHYRGLPRNTLSTIKNSSAYGYNEVEMIRLEINNATMSEKQEVESILKSGYIYGDADEGAHSKITLPSSDNVQFALYQTNSSNIRIDKTATLLHNYDNITLKENTSITKPTIRLKATDTNVTRGNYAYIPKFNRFYYVEDVKSVCQDVWEIDLKCDVLMSFRDDIIDQKVIFKRSESSNNLYLNDDRLQIDSRTNIYNYVFPHKIESNGTYVLLMAGNNS